MIRSFHHLVALCLVGTVIGTAEAGSSVKELLAGIPAVVADYGKGRQIKGAEVRAILKPQIQAMLASGRPVTPEQVIAWASELTDGMISQRLLLDEALKSGGKVDMKYGKEVVEAQRQNLGKKNFAALLTLQGISEKDYARRMAENHTVEEWIKNVVAPRQHVSPAEVKAYYDAHPEEFPKIAEYRVSHILFAADLKTPYEELLKIKDQAESVQHALILGADFATMAKKYSSCPSKADGGDLGFLAVGSMPKQFEEVALTLKPGEISPVVRSPLGYHIIVGNEIKPAGVEPFAKVQKKLTETLRRRAVDKAVKKLTEKLKREQKVRIYLTAP